MRENIIIDGDCEKVLTNWPDKSVDLILTDPQYPVKGFDIKNIAPKGIEEEMARVAKTAVIITSDQCVQYVPSIYRKQCDIICRIKNRKLKFNIFVCGISPSEVFSYTLKVDRSIQSHPVDHPYSLPQELIRLLIAWFSRKGELVVDPFCGSGIVPKIARDTGRRFIGIECNILYSVPLKAYFNRDTQEHEKVIENKAFCFA